jgi:hypothetical protein
VRCRDGALRDPALDQRDLFFGEPSALARGRHAIVAGGCYASQQLTATGVPRFDGHTRIEWLAETRGGIEPHAVPAFRATSALGAIWSVADKAVVGQDPSHCLEGHLAVLTRDALLKDSLLRDSLRRDDQGHAEKREGQEW